MVMLRKARGRKSGMKVLWEEFESYELDQNEPVILVIHMTKNLDKNLWK